MNEKIFLEKKMAIAIEELRFLKDIEFYRYMDFVTDNLIIGLKGIAENIRWPQNWIEAFKERWFPKWILKRFPVKYFYVSDKV